ncbi:hypothetical protein CHARACLAT_002510 [Characodon lateralis]|uniref:Uncharacterized protein n=1 Tax=Characodon lateralis TaxID=208331 RepID=A0ABU7DFL1_9TELE|nr:hypothetical protein [Characodon lateralis]
MENLTIPCLPGYDHCGVVSIAASRGHATASVGHGRWKSEDPVMVSRAQLESRQGESGVGTMELFSGH